MAQEKQTLPHKLSLDEREKLTMTGAREIIHFDEEMTKLVTDRGIVSVYGRELKLKTLSLEGGTVSVTGQIDGVIYDSAEKSGGRKGFWK